MTSGVRYVLVTPCKNEERTIGVTLASVLRQSVRPVEWIIVSDGSTDRTNEIVAAAHAQHDWIRLLALPARASRDFAAVVHATEAGVQALRRTDYTFIGLLDADVALPADYFAGVIAAFAASPHLGLAGGVVLDPGEPRDAVPRNLREVPGAVQFFRRDCFEALGGLIAVPEGGWDALTCAKARMLGYETRVLPQFVVDHLKPRNVAAGGRVRRLWQLGVRDYALGYHPLFALLKSIGRMLESPVAVGGVARWVGYCHATMRHRDRLVPASLLQFIHLEQKRRLRGLLPRPFHWLAR